jgi:hypothetical protein
MTDQPNTFTLYLSGMHDIVRLLQLLVITKQTGVWSNRLNRLGIHTFFVATEDIEWEAEYVIEANDAREEIRNAFDLTPSIELRFKLDPAQRDSRGESIGMLNMLRAIATLLAQFEGDAVLLGQDRDLLIRRQDGQTVMNTTWPAWTNAHITAFNLPHRRQPIAATKNRHAI